MIAELDRELAVARKQVAEGEPMGPVLLDNLERLGYVDRVPRAAEIARIVTDRTGRTLTRQRVSQLINAVKITPEVLEHLAKGLGVKASDLTRKAK